MIIPKRWKVADERGKIEGIYFRLKNAMSFADAMNEWSPQYFSGRKFIVRRIHG